MSKELAQRKARLETEGYEAWVKARTAKDFSLFAPKLSEIVQLNRDIADAVDPDLSPYASALDNYEKGMTPERIEEVRALLEASRTMLPQALQREPRVTEQPAACRFLRCCVRSCRR
jgi:carboxypeptidase Taq